MTGIGLGLLLWSTGNLVIGWSVGEFGLFGIEPTVGCLEHCQIAHLRVAVSSSSHVCCC